VFAAQIGRELVRNHLEFGSICAGTLELLHFLKKNLRLIGRFSDSPVICPGDMTRYQAEMADHRDAFSRHAFD
jgi:hypothetical protein